MRFSLSLLFPRVNFSSSCSFSSQERCSSTLRILVALHWILSGVSMSLFY